MELMSSIGGVTANKTYLNFAKSPEFAGCAVAAPAADLEVLGKSGTGARIGRSRRRVRLNDVDGRGKADSYTVRRVLRISWS